MNNLQKQPETTNVKLANLITQKLSDEINEALVGIVEISEGRRNPQMFDIYQATLIKPGNFNLRVWLGSTDYVDKWNLNEKTKAQIEDRDPRFVRTIKDEVIAAIFSFLAFPENTPIIWDGKFALAIVEAEKEKAQ